MQRLVEPELALVDQHHRRHAGDRLGHRIDAVDAVEVGLARAGEAVDARRRSPSARPGRGRARRPCWRPCAHRRSRTSRVTLGQASGACAQAGSAAARCRAERRGAGEPLAAGEAGVRFEQVHRHFLRLPPLSGARRERQLIAFAARVNPLASARCRYAYKTHAQRDLDPHRPRRAAAGDPFGDSVSRLGQLDRPADRGRLGVGLGALSRSNHGRNFCLVVFVIACLRLMLGGGII